MSSLGRRRRVKGDIDCEIDMVPIMNMFLVLIPFLLASTSFLNIKVINTSVPVMAEATLSSPDNKRLDIKIMPTIKLGLNRIVLEAKSSELEKNTLKDMGAIVSKNKLGEYEFSHLVSALEKIKKKYPKSDTLILVPNDAILYDTIVKTMDVTRGQDGEKLFPNVVISGLVQ